jgi:hypothetical protein
MTLLKNELLSGSSKFFFGLGMDKLKLTGQNLGRVFYFRYDRVNAAPFLCQGLKPPNFEHSAQPSVRFSPGRYSAPQGGLMFARKALDWPLLDQGPMS